MIEQPITTLIDRPILDTFNVFEFGVVIEPAPLGESVTQEDGVTTWTQEDGTEFTQEG